MRNAAQKSIRAQRNPQLRKLRNLLFMLFYSFIYLYNYPPDS